MKIFISVGSTASQAQEEFVSAVEKRLIAEGLEPKTVGRNTFGSQQPLKAIGRLMDECVGVVIIALERKYIEKGFDKRGSLTEERRLSNVRLPTPWVQIEAGMAYTRALPLLVIAEKGIYEEGLIAEGFDWFIQRVEPNAASLSTASFSGIFSDWKSRLAKEPTASAGVKTGELTIGELLRGLKPGELWKVAAALIALILLVYGIGVATAGRAPIAAAPTQNAQTPSPSTTP